MIVYVVFRGVIEEKELVKPHPRGFDVRSETGRPTYYIKRKLEPERSGMIGTKHYNTRYATINRLEAFNLAESQKEQQIAWVKKYLNSLETIDSNI